MKEVLRIKLKQAQESLDEAHALLADGAELNFVMNSLYFAFLYPVLGLLQARNISAPMQSAAIDLFEHEFVLSGDFDPRFMDALHQSFELRPSCACKEQKMVTREDIERLLPVAREFLERARQAAE